MICVEMQSLDMELSDLVFQFFVYDSLWMSLASPKELYSALKTIAES